jgi:hypothetical protein
MLLLCLEHKLLHVAGVSNNLIHVLLGFAPERDGFSVGFILLALVSKLVEAGSDFLGAELVVLK